MSLWLAKDQKSNEVVALQNALNLAPQPGKALVLDGVFGPLTEGAVHAFQKCQGLTADGIAGPHTLAALFTGYDATVKVSVAPTGAFGAKEGASPYSPPDRPAAKPPLSFGAISVLHREAIVRDWTRQGAPKDELDLPPVYHPDLVINRLAWPPMGPV
jgi:peptidoglycan hydrolase-like protein with peptidoglycan-binding domain